MKRVLRTAMMALLAAALCFGMLAPNANASVDTACNVIVPVKINVTGSQPVEGAYAQFTIKVLTEGAPIPFGGNASEVIWTVPVNAKGEATHNLSISFPELGVYHYTIQMTGGTYYHEESDGTLYNIEVYNLADGYEDSVQIWTDGNNKKYDSLNYTIPLMDLKVTKKWIDQDSSRPASVQIDVLRDGKKVTLNTMDFTKNTASEYTFSALTLSSKNAWQSSWSGLDSRLTYSVKEVKVPAGYTASYKYSGGIWYVTNTGSLLQTGQLNWPIPVLCAGGFLLMAVGLLLMKRKKEESDD